MTNSFLAFCTEGVREGQNKIVCSLAVPRYTTAMIRIFIFIAVFCAPFIFHAPAQADYFLWEDAKTGLTVTFPDIWKTQTNQNPDDILTIAGPSENGNPVCTIKATQDKRYVIYPTDFGRAVQKDAVSTAFWNSYMGLYDAYTLDAVYDGGGLGRWLASYALGSYDVRKGPVHQKRRAIMFASLYFDTLYIVECSSLNHDYDRWDNNFRSIIKSIDFKKSFHERPIGEYEDFIHQAEEHFWEGLEGTVSY